MMLPLPPLRIKTYFRTAVLDAIRAGHFKGRVSQTLDGDKWDLEEVYSTIVAIDLEPMIAYIGEKDVENYTDKSATPNVPPVGGFVDGALLILDGQHRMSEAAKRGQDRMFVYVLNEQLTQRLNKKKTPVMDNLSISIDENKNKSVPN